MCTSVLLQLQTVSLVSSVPSTPPFFPYSSSFFTQFSESWGERFVEDNPLNMVCTKVSRSVASSCGLLYWFPSRRKLLWWWLCRALIYGCSRLSLIVIVLVCYFSRTIIFGSPWVYGVSSLRFLVTLLVSVVGSISWGRPLIKSDCFFSYFEPPLF